MRGNCPAFFTSPKRDPMKQSQQQGESNSSPGSFSPLFSCCSSWFYSIRFMACQLKSPLSSAEWEKPWGNAPAEQLERGLPFKLKSSAKVSTLALQYHYNTIWLLPEMNINQKLTRQSIPKQGHSMAFVDGQGDNRDFWSCINCWVWLEFWAISLSASPLVSNKS